MIYIDFILILILIVFNICQIFINVEYRKRLEELEKGRAKHWRCISHLAQGLFGTDIFNNQ